MKNVGNEGSENSQHLVERTDAEVTATVLKILEPWYKVDVFFDTDILPRFNGDCAAAERFLAEHDYELETIGGRRRVSGVF